MKPLEHDGKVEPAYVRWASYVLLLAITVESIAFIAFQTYLRSELVATWLDLHNPIRLYSRSMLRSGMSSNDASDVDAFVSIGIVLCCVYLVFRVSIEFVRHDTRPSKDGLIYKLGFVECLLLLAVGFARFGTGSGLFYLTSRHSSVQNLFEINFMYAVVTIVAAEIAAQAIALSHDRVA